MTTPCGNDPWSMACTNYLTQTGNPEFERTRGMQAYCEQGDRLLVDDRCRRWCEESNDACRPRLREICANRTDKPICACFLGDDFYAKQQAELARTMNWPLQSISALPHCIHPPCATGAVDTGNPTPCPDQVQQTCLQTIKYDAGGHTYSVTGANLLAQCVMSNKQTGTATADVTQTGAPVTAGGVANSFFGKLQQTLTGYWREYNDPATSVSRQNTMLVVAAAGLFALLLLMDGGDGDDGGGAKSGGAAD